MTVSSGATIEVESGGVLESIDVKNGGLVIVDSGGFAAFLTVSSGGTLRRDQRRYAGKQQHPAGRPSQSAAWARWAPASR